jgi:tetratricopeptide (TPR) repeat protein
LINNGGKTKIADIYIYITGENFSETLRNLYLQFADEIEGAKKNNDAAAWMKKLPEIRSLINKGEHRQAMELFNNIPVKYRSGKIFQVMNVTISSGLSEEEYGTALDEYNKLFPNEPNAALLMIDGHILHKDYNKALEAVNMLDRQINKDPLLDYYRYLCYNLLNEKEKAKQHIEQVVKNIPGFGDGMLELIATYLEDHEYDKARPFVEKYKAKSSFDQTTLDLLLSAYPDY